MVSSRWISATWIMGNNYQGSGYYGAYPPSYIKRIYALYPEKGAILHLFSGSLKKLDISHPSARVDRLDINPKCRPEILADISKAAAYRLVQQRRPFGYDRIFADPPYSKQDAENYGTPLCNKRVVLEQCYKMLKPGGHLIWMDQSVPMYAKKFWHWYGVISIYRSTNHRVRGVMLFQKV